MDRIVILGQYKTGTTATYYKVRNALSSKRVWCLFEPIENSLPPDQAYDVVLAKVILGVDQPVEYTSFFDFDKVIYIVRDPRDWVISGVLFLLQQEYSIWSNPRNVSRVLELLRQKESDPESLSVLFLLDQFLNLAGKNVEDVLNWISNQQSWLTELEDKIEAHTLRYENLVQQHLSSLERYLGFELDPNELLVDDVHSHVARTCSSGDWKDWFLGSDSEVFRPLFTNYIERHGYANEWNVNKSRKIVPAHCSEYVKKVVQRKLDLA